MIPQSQIVVSLTVSLMTGASNVNADNMPRRRSQIFFWAVIKEQDVVDLQIGDLR